jgi:hypothetical protein
MAQRMTILATLAGLTAVAFGMIPAASNRIDAASNGTAYNATNQTAINQTGAYEATDTLFDVLVADWLPLLVLLIVCGAIIASTGILGEFR